MADRRVFGYMRTGSAATTQQMGPAAVLPHRIAGVRIHIGTSGYAYKEWKGVFYPEDLKADAMLGYYAERFDSVELNNTFYRMPKREQLESWASQVPASFRFAVKASRRITHIKRLKGDDGSLEYLLEQVTGLGDRLGPILFQLPPNMKKSVDRLAEMLPKIPRERRVAFEFRHASWADDEVFALLREHDAAWVTSDTEDVQEDAAVVPTARWGYLRLRRCDYEQGDLERWAQTIGRQPWETAYVYFKHEDEGTGPDYAARFRPLTESFGQ